MFGTPSGPAAFLGFTDPSAGLISCSCSVSVRVLEAGGGGSTGADPLTSKWAKKRFSSSARQASAFAVRSVFTALPHPRRVVLCQMVLDPPLGGLLCLLDSFLDYLWPCCRVCTHMCRAVASLLQNWSGMPLCTAVSSKVDSV